ncbi:MAG: hypothetical protein L6R40_004060 [Gallowayella cf. fulva]|nr:MAG: hypothetical protein L6R40_004060 [Xanthomendoza cf. fulva]
MKRADLVLMMVRERHLGRPPTPEDEHKRLDRNIFKSMGAWQWHYLKFCYELVQALLLVQTFDAVREAWRHAMRMLMRCGLDRTSTSTVIWLLHSLVPALDIRLSHPSDCYRFCRFTAFGFPRLEPSVIIHFQVPDILEPLPEKLIDGSGVLSHIAAVTIVKAKLFHDMTALNNSSVLLQKGLPPEIINIIREKLMEGSAVCTNRTIMYAIDQTSIIQALAAQIKRLYQAVSRRNQRYWPALFDPEIHMKARPAMAIPANGSVEEMQIALQHTFDAWLESPVALDTIRWLHRSHLYLASFQPGLLERSKSSSDSMLNEGTSSGQ